MTITDSAERPTPVRISFACWIINTIISLIGGIVLAAGAGSALFAGIDEADDESTAALTAAGILVIVFGLIQLWLVFRMRAGRNWARIVLTILGIASLASMWGGSTGGAINWINLVLLVAGVALMFAPANSDWFTSRPQHARG